MAAWDDDNMILQVFEQAEHQARHFFILIQKWEIYQSKTPLHSQQVDTFEHTHHCSKSQCTRIYLVFVCISIIILISGSQEMQEPASICPVGLYIIIVMNKACVNIIPLKSCNYSFVQLYSKWNKSSSDLQPGSAAVTMAEFRGAWKTWLTFIV